MLKFPVTYSLVSSIALENEVIALYNLPHPSRVVFIHQGINDTYLVNASKEKFILRIYRAGWKTLSDVIAELELLLFVHKSGLSVSYPLPDKTGEFIQQLDCPEGIRFAVMFTYASGESLSSLNVEHANLYGQYMARLHKITEGLKIEKISKDYTVAGILKNTRNNLLALSAHKDSDKMDNVCSQIEGKLNDDLLKKVRTGICHGDPHYENIFLDHSSGEITLFDFDFCGCGYLLYDLGSFCRYERSNEKNIDSFLQGYEQVLPLSQTEKELLPYFEILMRIFHLGARIKNADGIKNPKWLENDIGTTIRDINEQFCKIGDKLIDQA